MSVKIFDLTTLLDPIPTDHFFAEYWEAKPLLIRRGDTDYYKNLLTAEDLEHIISRTDMRYPALCLAKNGGFYPPEAYTANLKFGDDFFNGVPNVDRILSEYRSGATVTLPALHRTWGPLKDLCVALDTYLDHAAHANVYITPTNATGFTPHYDTHEVFILQIAGKKRWRVYEPPLTLPHRTQKFTPYGYTLPATPLLETELSTGDLLYLPRGYVHAASTTNAYSAHVTIGITVYTWVELAAELLKSCKETVKYRKALPPGFTSHANLKETLKQGLSDLIADLQKNSDNEKLLNLFSQRVKTGRTHAGGAFLCDIPEIGLRTTLNALEKYDYTTTQADGNIVLKFAGKTLVLSLQAQATFDAICNRKSFMPGELPGKLDDETKLALVRHLYKEGFLNLAD